MDFAKYQREVGENENYPNGISPQVYASMALSRGVGDISNRLIESINNEDEDKKRDDLPYKIGDVLYNLSSLCNALDLDLNEIAIDNLYKTNKIKPKSGVKSRLEKIVSRFKRG